jgi:hypothetical protein
MEDLLIVILQFFFEVLLQVLAELPWDLFVGSRQKSTDWEAGPGAWIFLSLAAGAGIGGISLLVFPTTLLHSSRARMANLIVAPAISGLVSFSFWRARKGVKVNRSDAEMRAVYAACFTFGLAVIRFAYAGRPHG